MLPERPAPDLTMGDRVTARFDTEPRATVNVFDRMETAGNRIKAADVEASRAALAKLLDDAATTPSQPVQETAP